MVLLRRVIGDALRARRQAQHRTLREVSTAANVSLGYLSEIERGQKEPSSELLSAICEALGAQLSELLRDVSHTVEHAERDALPAAERYPDDGVAAAPAVPTAAEPQPAPAARLAPAGRPAAAAKVPAAKAPAPRPVVTTTVEGDLAVTVRQDSPLRATLRATRTIRTDRPERDALAAV
ncbi:MAG TPA: helix-turn-helix transcriptional regulator [Rugosimonospora sp.]|nr:helix-turn-helix transcriptional regulator [Rugosimonospora sp.]